MRIQVSSGCKIPNSAFLYQDSVARKQELLFKIQDSVNQVRIQSVAVDFFNFQ